MQITVDVPNDFKDKHYSFTEDLIRAEIEKITGSPYKVVDFTAFYSNTPYTLRGNYDLETFEAERRNLDGTLVFTDKDFFERGPRPLDAVNKLFGYGNDILERVSWMKDKNGKIKGAKFKVWKKNAFEAETFEAREKKIGSIRIVKNPNFPSGTSLQAYIKTNRAELRKVFGNPNMGESGDGKSKGKEWNLVVGGKRVTIYDRREMGKKGTKYFNIGGDGKYGALLVAQALSIHRNERVHAKEIVPQWIEDRRQYQQVKSIDEHPDLTYERAKEYEDNRRRYRAESEDLREQFMEVAYNEIFENVPHEVKWESGGYLHTYETYDELVNGISSGEITPQMMRDCIKQLGAETFEAEEDYVDYTMWIYTKSTGGIFSGEWEDGESEEQVVKEWKELVREAIEQHGDDLITADLRKHSNYDEEGVAQSSEFLFEYEHGEDNLDDFEAEDDLTFEEWADQEMMTHGGRESFDDWLDDELKSHGDNISLQDWGHHELDSHYERYGSEALDYEDRLKLLYEDFCEDWEDNPDNDGQDCPSMDEWVDTYGNFDAESFEDFKRKMVGDGAVAGDVGYMEALEEFYEDYLEDFERITDEFCPEPETFEEFQERVLKNDYEMSLEAENWGGDPKGKLATALRKAREKAKKPQKPLKIEKLDAEEGGFYQLEVKYKMEDGWEHHSDYDNEEDATSAYYDIYLKYPEVILLEVDSDGEGDVLYRQRNHDVQSAETSGQWEIGEQLEEAQMNAEGSGRIDHEGGRMVAIDEVITVDYTWRTDPDDANVDEWRVHDEVEEKVESEMHIGDSSYGTFYTYDNDNNESVEVSYSWDKSIEDGGEEIIKSWAETDESLHAEGKKRKKLSGQLSDPFDELSLDSGDWKGIVAGFGVGLLALFGYSKLRK